MEEDGRLDKKELLRYIFSWDTFRDIGKGMKCEWKGHPLSDTDKQFLMDNPKRIYIMHCSRCEAPIEALYTDSKGFKTRLAGDDYILD